MSLDERIGAFIICDFPCTPQVKTLVDMCWQVDHLLPNLPPAVLQQVAERLRVSETFHGEIKPDINNAGLPSVSPSCPTAGDENYVLAARPYRFDSADKTTSSDQEKCFYW